MTDWKASLKMLAMTCSPLELEAERQKRGCDIPTQIPSMDQGIISKLIALMAWFSALLA